MGELTKAGRGSKSPLGYLVILLVSYAITGILLLLLAFLLYRFQIGKRTVEIGIVLIYVFSCFLGGFLTGKKARTRKYMWGAILGSGYFLVLAVVSLLAGGGLGNGFLSAFVFCVAGGMLGGMVS